MNMSTVLAVFLIPVIIFTAIDLDHLISGIRARKRGTSATEEKFILIGRAHGFPPASDTRQILKNGLRVVAGLAVIAYKTYVRYGLTA